MSIPPERDAGKLRPVDVLSIKQGPHYTVMFLGGVAGCDIHWSGGHSSICNGEGECGFSHAKNPPMWRGWAPVLYWDEAMQTWYARVLEVTASLEERLRGLSLRGMEWHLIRVPHKKKQGAVYGAFIDQVDATTLPPPFDIRPVLRRLYNTDRIELGKPNPLAPRTMLPHVAAPAPTLPTAPPAAAPERMTAEQREIIQQMAKGKFLPQRSSNGSPEGHGERGGHNGTAP